MNRLRSSRRWRRSLDSDVDMSHTWPALMADMGGTMRGTRCVTRGIAVDNEHPLYANRCELAIELAVASQAINRDRSAAPRSLPCEPTRLSLYPELEPSQMMCLYSTLFMHT
jgi:hypothetical protein